MKRTLLGFLSFLAALPLLGETRQRYTIATDGAPRTESLRVVSTAEGTISRRLRTFTHLSGFAADLTEEEAAALRNQPGIRAVEPVVERFISSIGSIVEDGETALETYDSQVVPWGLSYIKAGDVWPVTRGEGINVVVLDTGIDLEHPDLKRAYAGGYNALKPGTLPIDDNFHGTHVAGTIAATDNEFGIVGMAPDVRLWAVKSLDQAGKGYDEVVAAGIDWTIGKQQELGGRWIVNMSLGSSQNGGTLEREAVLRALDAGVILVAAAGNRGHGRFLDYPASYPGVIAVGAIGQDGRRAEFSQFGNGLEIVGPGVLLDSTYLTGRLEASDVIVNTETLSSLGLIGSAKGQLSGQIVPCGLGGPGDFPPGVAGNIALIARGGELAFREKARNAKAAGAVAVVIYDNLVDQELLPWTLLPNGCPSGSRCEPEWRDYQFPLTVGVTRADGHRLLAHTSKTAKVSFIFSRYAQLSGTSMATPHVSGTAALLLALDPSLKPVDISYILRKTARDTGDEGWDVETGYGVVDALEAAKFVAPERFGEEPPPPSPSRRRGARH